MHLFLHVHPSQPLLYASPTFNANLPFTYHAKPKHRVKISCRTLILWNRRDLDAFLPAPKIDRLDHFLEKLDDLFDALCVQSSAHLYIPMGI